MDLKGMQATPGLSEAAPEAAEAPTVAGPKKSPASSSGGTEMWMPGVTTCAQ